MLNQFEVVEYLAGQKQQDVNQIVELAERQRLDADTDKDPRGNVFHKEHETFETYWIALQRVNGDLYGKQYIFKDSGGLIVSESAFITFGAKRSSSADLRRRFLQCYQSNVDEVNEIMKLTKDIVRKELENGL